MPDFSNIIFHTYPFLKKYKKKDGKRQVMVRVKTGYSELGNRVFTKTYDIKLLSESKERIHLSKQEFDLKESNRNFIYRYLKVEELIHKAILKFNRENKPISTSLITEYIYSVNQSSETEFSDNEVNNDFLKKLGIPPMPQDAYDEFISTKHIDADTNEPVLAEDLEDIATSLTAKHYEKKHQQEIERMHFEERYKKGYYDKNNIFDLFGYCWSIKKQNKDFLLNDVYRSLLLRLHDYRYNAIPPERIETFNKKWVSGFIEFMAEQGYANYSPKGYDPFNLEKTKIRFIEAERKPYKMSSFTKQIKHLKRYINILQDYDIIKVRINTRTIDSKDYVKKGVNLSTYTRREHALSVEEFKKLCEADLSGELDLARDMFIIAVLGGGFRGEEFYNQELSFEKRDGRYFTRVYHSKNQAENLNPAYGELLKVIKKYNCQIPEFLPINTFRNNLKAIAEKLEFNRIIRSPDTTLNANQKFQNDKLKDIFSIYFARKTCVKLLGHYGFTNEEIIEFTRHADTRTLRFYKGKTTEEEKIRKLKEKGLI